MPAMKCGACGVESDYEAAFQRGYRTCSTARVLVCPACYQRQQKQVEIAGTICAALSATAVLAYCGWFGGNVWLIYLCFALGIVLHELGHALMARLVRLRLHAIMLGAGPIVAKTAIGRISLTLRLLPISGCVAASPTCREDATRWRLMLFALGGPLANVLPLPVLLFLAWRELAAGQQMDRSVAPAQAAVVASLLLLFLCLVCRHGELPGYGRVVSDGGLLLQIRDMPEPALEDWYIRGCVREGCRRSIEGRHEAAKAHFAEPLKRYPDNSMLRAGAAIAALEAGEVHRARSIFEELLIAVPAGDQEIATRVRLQNCLAWTDLIVGSPELMLEADRLSQEAYQQTPWDPYVQGTRGSVLIEKGETTTGAALVHRALDAHEDAPAKSACMAFLAAAEADEGNRGKAQRLLRKARRMHPSSRVINRVLQTHKISFEVPTGG